MMNAILRLANSALIGTLVTLLAIPVSVRAEWNPVKQGVVKPWTEDVNLDPALKDETFRFTRLEDPSGKEAPRIRIEFCKQENCKVLHELTEAEMQRIAEKAEFSIVEFIVLGAIGIATMGAGALLLFGINIANDGGVLMPSGPAKPFAAGLRALENGSIQTTEFQTYKERMYRGLREYAENYHETDANVADGAVITSRDVPLKAEAPKGEEGRAPAVNENSGTAQ